MGGGRRDGRWKDREGTGERITVTCSTNKLTQHIVLNDKHTKNDAVIATCF